jgi:hypothetical protein
MAAPLHFRPAAASLLPTPHYLLLAAASLLVASLLPPESTWVARLVAATLRARPATANPARSQSWSPSRRSRTRTLQPGPVGWSQECCRCRCKLENSIIKSCILINTIYYLYMVRHRVVVITCHTCFSKENQEQTHMHAWIKFHAYSWHKLITETISRKKKGRLSEIYA